VGAFELSGRSDCPVDGVHKLFRHLPLAKQKPAALDNPLQARQALFDPLAALEDHTAALRLGQKLPLRDTRAAPRCNELQLGMALGVSPLKVCEVGQLDSELGEQKTGQSSTADFKIGLCEDQRHGVLDGKHVLNNTGS